MPELVMHMTRHDAHSTSEDGLTHLNPIKAHLLMIFGPANADGGDNPLTGTQYDPVVRQHHDAERQHERWARQDRRHRARAVRRHSVRRAAREEPDHLSTPDEV